MILRRVLDHPEADPRPVYSEPPGDSQLWRERGSVIPSSKMEQ
jgi:hypothetical protein